MMEKEYKLGDYPLTDTITHLTNDEYTYLINYITEKENKAREETLKEVEKIIYKFDGQIGQGEIFSLIEEINKLKEDLKK
jgi:hypothetical protein